MDLGEELDIWRVATGFRLANLPSKIEKYQWSLFCPYNVYGFNKLCRPLVANSNKLHEFCVSFGGDGGGRGGGDLGRSR